jgi:hypothetical protein
LGNDAVSIAKRASFGSAPSGSVAASWVVARSFCEGEDTGGRSGWLPAFNGGDQEPCGLLRQFGTVYLPGNPFVNVEPNQGYWTGTSGSATIARTFGFDLSGGSADKVSIQQNYWCVRGGSGFDALS